LKQTKFILAGAVPEPETWALVAIGGTLIIFRKNCKKLHFLHF
jgi:hypothetical protein